MPGVSTFHTAAFINQPTSPFSYLPICCHSQPQMTKVGNNFPARIFRRYISAPHLNWESIIASTALYSADVWCVRLLFHSINIRRRKTVNTKLSTQNSDDCQHVLSFSSLCGNRYLNEYLIQMWYRCMLLTQPPLCPAGPFLERTSLGHNQV